MMSRERELAFGLREQRSRFQNRPQGGRVAIADMTVRSPQLAQRLLRARALLAHSKRELTLA